MRGLLPDLQHISSKVQALPLAKVQLNKTQNYMTTHTKTGLKDLRAMLLLLMVDCVVILVFVGCACDVKGSH